MYSESFKELYFKRRSLRLPGYNYSWPGAYFVTICTHEKQNLFGNITDSSMKLNPYGEIVQLCWKDIPYHYPEVNNETFMVMPNHIHGIIILQDDQRAGLKPAPTKRYALSEIVRAFKTYSSRGINELRNSPGKSVWQRSYYEHIIRSESEYQKIGEYILYNPSKWETDQENLDAKRK